MRRVAQGAEDGLSAGRAPPKALPLTESSSSSLFHHANAVRLLWGYLRSPRGGNEEARYLREIKVLFAPHEAAAKRRFEQVTSAGEGKAEDDWAVSTSDVSLAAAVEAYSSVIRATKGAALFSFGLSTMVTLPPALEKWRLAASATTGDGPGATRKKSKRAPVFPWLSVLADKVLARASFADGVYMGERRSMERDQFMARVARIEGAGARLSPDTNDSEAYSERVQSGMKLPCFVEARTDGTPTARHDKWLPASVHELANDPEVPLLVMRVGADGAERVCPFSLTVELALAESKIRHAKVMCTSPPMAGSSSFMLPAMRVGYPAAPGETHKWVFGVHGICNYVKAVWPAHAAVMFPRIIEAPAFSFVPRGVTSGGAADNGVTMYSEAQMAREGMRELLFGYILGIEEEAADEAETRVDGAEGAVRVTTLRNTRDDHDLWVGERDQRMQLELHLRALWSPYENVLSTTGGKGTLYLSGDAGVYGPGVLDLLLFATLEVLRPCMRVRRGMCADDDVLLEAEPAMCDWFYRMRERDAMVAVLGEEMRLDDDPTGAARRQCLARAEATFSWIEDEIRHQCDHENEEHNRVLANLLPSMGRARENIERARTSNGAQPQKSVVMLGTSTAAAAAAAAGAPATPPQVTADEMELQARMKKAVELQTKQFQAREKTLRETEARFIEWQKKAQATFKEMEETRARELAEKRELEAQLEQMRSADNLSQKRDYYQQQLEQQRQQQLSTQQRQQQQEAQRQQQQEAQQRQQLERQRQRQLEQQRQQLEQQRQQQLEQQRQQQIEQQRRQQQQLQQRMLQQQQQQQQQQQYQPQMYQPQMQQPQQMYQPQLQQSQQMYQPQMLQSQQMYQPQMYQQTRSQRRRSSRRRTAPPPRPKKSKNSPDDDGGFCL